MRHVLQMLSAGLMYKAPANFYHFSRYFSTNKKSIDILNIAEGRFADPTYDDTFRRLFGEEAHKEILVSALNSFLGFTGKKAIVNVEINNPALEKRKIFGLNPSITGAIDILCTTDTNQKIAVEMQGKKTAYFLAREQEYMAKLISGKVTEGEGKNYHNKVLDTYIIVISKSNIFIGNTALKDQSLYEIDVAPTVRQTNEVYPGNKMYWKFFELKKFAEHKDSQNITKESPLKLQWLDFLLSCPAHTDIPEDSDYIIKESYHVMDKMNWNPDERTIHWKNTVNQQEGEQLLSEGREEGKAEGRVEEKIKLLSGIKIAINKGLDHDTLVSIFSTFEESELTKVEAYISTHPDCSTDELTHHIGLAGDLHD